MPDIPNNQVYPCHSINPLLLSYRYYPHEPRLVFPLPVYMHFTGEIHFGCFIGRFGTHRNGQGFIFPFFPTLGEFALPNMREHGFLVCSSLVD